MPHAPAISNEKGSALSWVLCGALFLSALVFTPGVFHFYDVTPKVAILLLSCAACLTLRKTWLPGFSLLPHNPMGRAFLALLGLQTVSVVVSTVFSFEPLLSLTGTNWRRLGLATELALISFALVAASFVADDKRRVLILVRAIALTGFAGALYGISQYFGFDPLLDPARYHVGEGYWTIVRIPGTLGHAGYFATFLLHGVFAGGALWAAEQRRLWRVFGISTAAIASAAIVLSGTRSAILGLAAGTVLLWAWRRPVPRTRAWLVIAAIVVSAVAFYFTPPGQKLRARTRWYAEDSRGGARLGLYGDSLAMGADHWLAGTGLETFSSRYPKYQSLEVAQAFPNTYYESPHNILLDAWTSQGLPGVLALGGLIAVAGLAKDLEFDNKSHRVRLLLDEAEEEERFFGILDGGNTNRRINDWREDLGEEEGLDRLGKSFVNMQVLIPKLSGASVPTGDMVDLLNDIKEARNRSVQVKTKSLADARDHFEILKSVLRNEPYFDKIAWHEGQRGSIDALQIIIFLMIFYPSFASAADGREPSNAYGHKERCLAAYLDYASTETEELKKWLGALPMIIRLYDELRVTFPDRYGGRFGKIKEVTIYDEQRYERGKKKYRKTPMESLFFGKQMKYGYPVGWVYPLLAAFRVLIGPDKSGEAVEWKRDPLDFWKVHGKEISMRFEPHMKYAGYETKKIATNLLCYQAAQQAVNDLYKDDLLKAAGIEV